MSQTEEYSCRYCLTIDFPHNLISPCLCAGSVKYVHKTCLLTWIESKRNNVILPFIGDTLTKCEICKYEYQIISTYEVNTKKVFSTVFYESIKYIVYLTLFNLCISGIFTDLPLPFIKGDGFNYRFFNVCILYFTLIDFIWFVLICSAPFRNKIMTWFFLFSKKQAKDLPIVFVLFYILGFAFWPFYDIAAQTIEKNSKQIIDILDRS